MTPTGYTFFTGMPFCPLCVLLIPRKLELPSLRSDGIFCSTEKPTHSALSDDLKSSVAFFSKQTFMGNAV